MGPLFRQTLSGLYMLSQAPAYRRFRQALKSPQQAQETILKTWLHRHRYSLLAQKYRLDTVQNYQDFTKKAPITTYPDYQEAIDQAFHGNHQALSLQPLKAFEPSSGSTGGNKFIPYPQALLDEFSSATQAWLFDLLHNYPVLRQGTSYWSVSPAARKHAPTPSGIRIGLEDDTEYFPPWARWMIQQLLAAPGDLSQIKDIERWQTTTLFYLLSDENLALFSVWSPSFLLRLLEHIERNLDELLKVLPTSRERAIKEGLQQKGRFCGEALWPKLHLVSCWCDGHARAQAQALKKYFPETIFQPKGLLATEGVISIPLVKYQETGSILALSSHFLEFFDPGEGSNKIYQPWQLKKGGIYSPLLTTGSGFVRYHLKDLIKVQGFVGQVPLISFEGKQDRNMDLAGEKLGAIDAERVIAELRSLYPSLKWAMIVPQAEPKLGYVLLVEGIAESQTTELSLSAEKCLTELYHYNYCRDLQQLAPLQVQVVTQGTQKFQMRLLAEGIRLGDIKPTPIEQRFGWPEYFMKTMEDS